MAERAKVGSIEALEAFRISLILYLDRAGRTLDEISDDVLRMRLWLQTDRRQHWEKQVRLCLRGLEEAQQALFSARLSGLREVTQAEQTAVQVARRALAHAEGKLRLVRQWERQYDSRVEPLAKEVDKFRNVLKHDMGKGVAYLAQAITTLTAYAELAPPPSSAPLAAAPAGTPEEPAVQP